MTHAAISHYLSSEQCVRTNVESQVNGFNFKDTIRKQQTTDLSFINVNNKDKISKSYRIRTHITFPSDTLVWANI